MGSNKASQTLRVAILCLTFFQTVVSKPETLRNWVRIIDYDTLRNVVFLRSTETIIVAGDKMLHKLKGDLSLQKNVSVCGNTGNCSNVMNKVLLHSSIDNTTIVCGTQNGGMCEKRSIENLSLNPTPPFNFPNEDEIASQAVITSDNGMNIAVVSTYKTPTGSNVTYKISKLDSQLKMVGSEIQIRSEINSTEPIVYFMKAEVDQKKRQSYFFINEKPSGDSKYWSKMVVVCDGGQHHTVNLQCNSSNKDYYQLQDATLLAMENVHWLSPGERLFVGIFRSANVVTDESGESAICVKKMSDMAISPLCTGGTSPVTMEPVYIWPSDRGNPITLAGYRVPDTSTVVLQFGTSKGRFVQFFTLSANLRSFGDNLELFADQLVQAGAAVVAIHTSDVSEGTTYVATTNKIAAYSPGSCNQLTCKETVESRNPYCGWCVWDGKSTSKSACTSGNWTSVFSPCVSLTLSQDGQKADTSTSATVTVTAINFKWNGSETFQCKIMGREISAATVDGISFTCKIPPSNDHRLATLTLEGKKSNGGTYIVGSSPYWYYKCAKFKRCGECTGTAGVQCQWCSAKCQDSCQTQSARKRRSEVPCPKVNDSPDQYLPNDNLKRVSFDVSHIPAGEMSFEFACIVPDSLNTKQFPGVFGNDKVACNMTVQIPENVSKQNLVVIIKYGQSQSALVEIDGNSTVIVYRPDMLANDCTHCKYLNKTRYQCSWNGTSCVYDAADFRNPVECSGAALTQITPPDVYNQSQTLVTISGSDMLGDNSSSISVQLGGSICTGSTVNAVSKPPEFTHTIIDSVTCKTSKHSSLVDAAVTVTVVGKVATSDIKFSYVVPNILSVSPAQGIKKGGIKLTFAGTNLASGKKKVAIKYNKSQPLINCTVISNSIIECVVPGSLSADMKSIRAFFDGGTQDPADDGIYNFNLAYTLLENPIVTNVTAAKTISSGGLVVTILGENINNTGNRRLTGYYNGIETTKECEKANATSTMIRCQSPPAPANMLTDLEDKLNQNKNRRRKRSATCPCIEVVMKIQMDGFEKDITMSYYPDPRFKNMTDVTKLEPDEEKITLTGDYLNLVAMVEDFVVNIGEGLCTDLVLTDTSLECKVPKHDPDGSKHSVTVKVGNYQASLGSLQYGEVNRLKEIVTIVGSVLGVVIGIAALVIVVLFGKYQLLKRQKRKLEKKLEDTEMEVRSIARQEFVEMANGMLLVNRNLVEQGLPFHGYQQYAFNVLFSADQVLIDQAGQMRSPTKKALDSLEKLILNKFFLISLVSTMEKQKRFFQRERANMSGNLCAILMGKMGYLNDVLQVLLMELVKDAVARKQHKSLFRSCETITESLLYNWLALTLYPHFRSSSGSPLYLLYMAMQLTMESGPIDAHTYDAKYTLSEERILRRWESTKQGETGVTLEAKPLTLKVIIDNGDQMYDCKVLDCDTITQVKSKCLTQIYVNYPASQLGVDPAELLLNWHAGNSTHMTLKDEDKSSVREGNLLRHNTLAHYNVRDNANVALVDPKTLDQEDYMNLGGINLEFQGASQDTSQLLNKTGNDGDDPADLYKWHLVKPTDEDAEPAERSAIDELYLNKLFTTKQSILQYITALFDHILDSAQCPPPAKYVCDYMDILANTYKIDEQTLNTWKSKSYAARIWGNLIRNPSQLFDVVVPPYLEDSLGVIAQVFDDCLAASSPKFNKDTPGHKLVFHSETTIYREKAKEFHKGLQTMGEQANELTDFLGDLNKFQQQQQSFNKIAYLQKFFDQLGPYLEEIVEGLRENKEAKDLELDRKMQEVIDMMKD